MPLLLGSGLERRQRSLHCHLETGNSGHLLTRNAQSAGSSHANRSTNRYRDRHTGITSSTETRQNRWREHGALDHREPRRAIVASSAVRDSRVELTDIGTDRCYPALDSVAADHRISEQNA